MKAIYSVLLVSDERLNTCVVVCETQQDEKDVLRSVRNQGHNVSTLARREGDLRRYPIWLNDYELG